MTNLNPHLLSEKLISDNEMEKFSGEEVLIQKPLSIPQKTIVV